MKLSVLSNDDLHMRINNNELNDNTAVICFYSKALGKPKELMKSDARMLLIPYDDWDYDDLVCKDDYDSYFPQARKTAEFIRSAVADGCELICPDDCGSTATLGCAAAILEYYESRGLDIFANESYIPNKLVYQKVFDALCEVCGQKPQPENTIETAITSRSKMQKLIHSGKLGEDTAVISFHDIAESPIYFGGTKASVLTLALDDLGPTEISERYGSLTRYFTKAGMLAQFIVAMAAKGKKIICQCEMGMSRSAACAAAILQYYCGSGISIFTDKRYCPNRIVFQKLFAALCTAGVQADVSQRRTQAAKPTVSELYDVMAQEYADIVSGKNDGYGGLISYMIVTKDKILHGYDLWNSDLKISVLKHFFERYGKDDIEYICLGYWREQSMPQHGSDIDTETGVLYFGNCSEYGYFKAIKSKYGVTQEDWVD